MRTLIFLSALFLSPFALAADGDEPAAEENDAPKYLLGEVGIRVDIPEEGWKSDHWSDWDFKATSDDGIVLVAWTTPYQVEIREEDLEAWAPVYTKQAEIQGGVSPEVVTSALSEVQGRAATSFEIKMGTTKDVDLLMFAHGIAANGENFHIAAVAMPDKRDQARETLDGVLERLEITAQPEEIVWGGAVATPGKVGLLNTTLDDYWRQPLKKERSKVTESVRTIGVPTLKGCWTAIHPHAGGVADLLVTCQDKNHSYPIMDKVTFDDQEAELRDAWLGSPGVAKSIDLGDRLGFWWETKIGKKQIHVGATPNDLGMVKMVAWANGGKMSQVGDAALATLKNHKFAEPKPPEVGEQIRYYLTYKPYSPVVIGPIVAAVVVLLMIFVLIIIGLRRSRRQAIEEMEAI